MILIGHAKEAEEKRIQEMKKFAEDRERYAKMQTAMVTGSHLVLLQHLPTTVCL